MKKVLSLILALCLCFSICPAAFADNSLAKGEFFLDGEIAGNTGYLDVIMQLPAESIDVYGIELSYELPDGFSLNGAVTTGLKTVSGKWEVNYNTSKIMLQNSINEKIGTSNSTDDNTYTIARIPLKVSSTVDPGNKALAIKTVDIAIKDETEADGIGSGKDYFVETNSCSFSYIRSIASAKVTNIVSKIYSGSNRTQIPVVTVNGIELTNGMDYKVTYSNNLYAGKATVTITGYGYYTGTVKKYFYILPAQISGNKKVSSTVSSAKISWNKSKSADGYVVYRSTSKTSGYSLIKTIYGTSTYTYYNSGLLSGKYYYYKVAAFKTIDGKKYFGSFSSVASVKTLGYAVPTPSKAYASKSTSSSITVKWSGVANASGYTIYRSTNSKSGFKAIKSVSASTKSYTNKSLKSSTVYYYRVAAFRKYNGAAGYGSTRQFTAATAPKSTKISSAKNSAKKAATVKWKKSSGASGYVLYYSTSKSGKYKKIYSGTKLTYTKKSLKKGKKYYFKVKPYKKLSSKKIYGSLSTAKYVKISR